MKKRILAALLAALTIAAVSVAAVGCGSAPAENTESETSQADVAFTEEEKQEEGSIVFDEPVTIVDNEYVTVKLTQFYEEEVNWVGLDDPAIEKNFVLNVKNHTDYEICFDVENAYIEDNVVQIWTSNSSNMIPAGKISQLAYNVRQNTKPEATPLDSIDDLYNLEGEISVIAINDTGKGYGESVFDKKFEFSLKESK